MALNLIRNSKVYFTTNLDSNNRVNASGFTTSNTWRIEVLEGFTFSQATTTENITVNEAGPTPTRGQRAFNTALDPVEFSMSTYIRPYYLEAGASDSISAPEKVLWNALMGSGALGSGAWVETPGVSGGTTVCAPTVSNSNVHQLQAFGLVVVLDTLVYYIDNCALESATIDFGLDAIATIAWAGRGTRLRQSETKPTLVAGTNFVEVPTTAAFIANKLSTTTVKAGIGGTGESYTVPITGGSITYSNNLTYLTPAVLGVVNKPVTYFTGTRAISGTLTAYMRSDAASKFTAELQSDILTGSDTASDTKYYVKVEVGGITKANRVEIEVPAAMLSIPEVNAEQLISTTINFTGQAYTGADYDLTQANEVEVAYFAAP